MSKSNAKSVEKTINEFRDFLYEAEDYITEALTKKEIERISNIMNKGCPSVSAIVNGETFVLKFMQQPYDDRYFKLFHGNNVIMSVHSFLAANSEHKMFEWLGISAKKWDKFLKDIDKFDEKMDTDESEVKTWLDE